jgi:hypothetical protein
MAGFSERMPFVPDFCDGSCGELKNLPKHKYLLMPQDHPVPSLLAQPVDKPDSKCLVLVGINRLTQDHTALLPLG